MMVGRRSFLFGMAKIQGPPTNYGATAGLLKYQQYLLVRYHQRDVRTQKSNLIPSIHMLVHPVFFKDTPLFLRCNSERFGTWVHKTQKLYRTLGVLTPSNSAPLQSSEPSQVFKSKFHDMSKQVKQTRVINGSSSLSIFWGCYNTRFLLLISARTPHVATLCQKRRVEMSQ